MCGTDDGKDGGKCKIDGGDGLDVGLGVGLWLGLELGLVLGLNPRRGSNGEGGGGAAAGGGEKQLT